MATQNKIVDPRTIANNVARVYRLDNVTPKAVHDFAELNGWTLRKIGGKRGYLASIESLIASKINLFKKCVEQANIPPKPKVNPDSINPDERIESDAEDKKYEEYLDDTYGKKEESIDRCIKAAINEVINKKGLKR